MHAERPVLLALNLGSSSLKAAYHSLSVSSGVSAEGERLAIALHDAGDALPDPSQALSRVASLLPDNASVAAVGHRIVHGGDRSEHALLTPSVIDELSRWSALAPLHQPQALALVRAAMQRWPAARHVAVFDTVWHAGLAAWSRRLPLPRALHDAGVMRFGFHGLAFQSSHRMLARHDPVTAAQRVVLAHLGSGSSLCAMFEGRSIDTTMGFTPLDGLPMATRCGSLDPGVVLYLKQHRHLTHEAIERLLWRESGLRGVSGTTGDMRALLADGSETARLAVEQFAVRVAQGIAAMATSLGGVDAIVFSGGIGSHSPPVREKVVERLAWIGARLDRDGNEQNQARIGAADSRLSIWAIEVDEEHEIAVATAPFLSASPSR